MEINCAIDAIYKRKSVRLMWVLDHRVWVARGWVRLSVKTLRRCLAVAHQHATALTFLFYFLEFAISYDVRTKAQKKKKLGRSLLAQLLISIQLHSKADRMF